MYNFNNYQSSRFVIVAFCALLVFGCSSDGTTIEHIPANPESVERSSETSQNDSVKMLLRSYSLNKLIPAGMLPYPYVSESELSCVESEFNKYLQLENGSAIALPQQKIRVLSFLEEVDEYTSNLNCNGELVLVAYHGLDAGNRYTSGFSLACLPQSSGGFSISGNIENLYTIEGNSFVKSEDSNALQNWKAEYLTRYKEGVRFKRNDGGDFMEYDAEYDVRYIIYPLGRVIEAIDANSSSIKYLEVASYSSPLKWQSPNVGVGFTHGIAMVPCDVNGERMVDDSTYNNTFINKAMNLGSPCPNYCADAQIFSKGIPVRSNCP